MTWTYENGRFRDEETGQYISVSEVLERRHRRRDLAVATFSLVVALAGVGVSIELTRRQNELAAEAFADQQISSAWQILALEGTGTTGKRYALEVLMRPDQPISGIDLSCMGRGAKWQENGIGSYECEAPTDLRGLKVGTVELPAPQTVKLQRADMTGADLSGARIYGSEWQKVVLDGTTLQDTLFSGMTMTEMSWRVAPWLTDATVAATSLSNVDFTRSNLTSFTFTEVTFSGEFNISNTLFCDEEGQTCTTGLTGAFFDGAWYYADMPPLGLSRVAPAGTTVLECSLTWEDETGLGFAEAYQIDRQDMQPFHPADCRLRDVPVEELPISTQDLLLD